MTPTQIQSLIDKMQETYEAGKPFADDFSERWKDQQGFLQTMRFILSMQQPDDLMGKAQKSIYLTYIDQIIKDVTALFAALSAYQGLTLALKGILKEYQEEQA